MAKQLKKRARVNANSEPVTKTPEPTPDTSPYVFQRDKFKGNLNIRELPWTEKQKAIIKLFLDKGTKALFLKGPAGSSKSLLAMYCGLRLLDMKRVSDMVLIRAAVESADAKLGYLPGDIDSKLGVHLQAFYDKFTELLSKSDLAALERDERIVPCPISYARGLHFAAKFICADELQNCSRKEIHTVLSRVGEYAKVFLCGDPEQSDLPYGKSGFSEVYNLFDNEESRGEGIFCVELFEEDIVRSQFCRFVTKKFKELNNRDGRGTPNS